MAGHFVYRFIGLESSLAAFRGFSCKWNCGSPVVQNTKTLNFTEALHYPILPVLINSYCYII